MIGLMFFGVIGLWVLLAMYLAYKIPRLLGAPDRQRWPWFFVLVPLLIFLPVIDEVIAYPQAMALCKQAENAFWYDPAATGGVLKYYGEYKKTEQVIGLNIKALVDQRYSILLEENRPVIRYMKVYFSSGFLKFPDGSSGNPMPLILPDHCPSDASSMEKYRAAHDLLQLIDQSRP